MRCAAAAAHALLWNGASAAALQQTSSNSIFWACMNCSPAAGCLVQVSFSLNRFVKFIGPGLLMSIAYVVSSCASTAHTAQAAAVPEQIAVCIAQLNCKVLQQQMRFIHVSTPAAPAGSRELL
jgi:hypothetical protein